MPEQLKGSACPSGPPRWPSKRRPQMPRGSERAHPEASPWRQCPDIQGSSDLGPRAQGLPDTPAAANRAAEEVLPLRGLGSPLLPARSAPAEVPGQGGERCEDGGTSCLDKTEGTLQREMQNNQENMPEVTSRAQGTKKESGRNRANSEKPRRKPIP